ncbi:MAG TPA: hypothetical protein ACFYD4_14585 [Candidatus Wunengus sp. YC61]|uniref:hypothetical protein n=1 Tax=Candidatus Wunengus sp. YC61 TaxID=3367698 RepID=UPI0040298AFA
MKTKIYSLSVMNLDGSKTYCVGTENNGLLINNIEDCSLEYADSVTVIYRGYTADKFLVFEVINAPIDVEYCPV